MNVQYKLGSSAISIACMNGRVEALRLLRDHGGDINVRGYLGKTPLMHAIECGHSACVLLLLERGADMAITNQEGKTAYDYCKSEDTKKMLTDAANKIGYVLK